MQIPPVGPSVLYGQRSWGKTPLPFLESHPIVPTMPPLSNTFRKTVSPVHFGASDLAEPPVKTSVKRALYNYGDDAKWVFSLLEDMSDGQKAALNEHINQHLLDLDLPTLDYPQEILTSYLSPMFKEARAIEEQKSDTFKKKLDIFAFKRRYAIKPLKLLRYLPYGSADSEAPEKLYHVLMGEVPKLAGKSASKKGETMKLTGEEPPQKKDLHLAKSKYQPISLMEGLVNQIIVHRFLWLKNKDDREVRDFVKNRHLTRQNRPELKIPPDAPFADYYRKFTGEGLPAFPLPEFEDAHLLPTQVRAVTRNVLLLNGDMHEKFQQFSGAIANPDEPDAQAHANARAHKMLDDLTLRLLYPLPKILDPLSSWRHPMFPDRPLWRTGALRNEAVYKRKQLLDFTPSTPSNDRRGVVMPNPAQNNVVGSILDALLAPYLPEKPLPVTWAQF